MIDEQDGDEQDEDLDALEEPVTVADAVALLSTLRTGLAALDGVIRSAIRDLVGEDDEPVHAPSCAVWRPKFYTRPGSNECTCGATERDT